MANQLWRCVICENERFWGWGKPEPELPKRPWLTCSKCGQTTQHLFVKVDTTQKETVYDY